MPLPPEQRTRFFVFVIESPSAADLYHRRSEGDVIKQAVTLNGLGCEVRTAINLEAFNACLRVGLQEAMGIYPGHMPLLHISAHGNGEGIQLSDGSVLSWDQLKDLLRPVNEAFAGALFVCMSSCQGYAGTRMAMDLKAQKLPYFALVGCNSQPTWAETAVGYATFYHQLCIGEPVGIAVDAMRTASGKKDFFLEHAEKSRQSYAEYVAKRATDVALRNLLQLNAEHPVPVPGEGPTALRTGNPG